VCHGTGLWARPRRIGRDASGTLVARAHRYEPGHLRHLLPVGLRLHQRERGVDLLRIHVLVRGPCDQRRRRGPIRGGALVGITRPGPTVRMPGPGPSALRADAMRLLSKLLWDCGSAGLPRRRMTGRPATSVLASDLRGTDRLPHRDRKLGSLNQIATKPAWMAWGRNLEARMPCLAYVRDSFSERWISGPRRPEPWRSTARSAVIEGQDFGEGGFDPRSPKACISRPRGSISRRSGHESRVARAGSLTTKAIVVPAHGLGAASS
jgi:hypothetical protein